jgi:hypothetical protein
MTNHHLAVISQFANVLLLLTITGFMTGAGDTSLSQRFVTRSAVITCVGDAVSKLFAAGATFIEGRAGKKQTDDRLADSYTDFLNSDRLIVRIATSFAMFFDFVVAMFGRSLLACVPSASNPASPIFVLAYLVPFVALILLLWSFLTRRLPLSRVRTLNNMSFWAVFAGLLSHAYYAGQLQGTRLTATLMLVGADLISILVHASRKDVHLLNVLRGFKRWQLEMISAVSSVALAVGANRFR